MNMKELAAQLAIYIEEYEGIQYIAIWAHDGTFRPRRDSKLW